MARIHARKKGKSQSTRPYRAERPQWTAMKHKEIERMVIRLADEGYSTSVIGMKLRDQYGVPSVKLCTGKSVLKILAENKRSPKLPEDLRNLMKKAVNMGEHLEENPKDIHNRRALALTEAKIRRLMRYYKTKGTLPKDWIYNLKSAKLLVE
ncbi:MAG: 30S ribosomal protein S15 [Thermoplasmata archaeon]|nr:MAG: 30S ribosomal protein S15 [Thermoplasmata archaeon]